MVPRVRRDEADGVGRGPQVAPYEGEVAGLDGGVRAGAHGQAQVGLGQRGRVVDAVADHRHRTALVLEPLDDVDLVLRHDLGDDLVDADLGGDGLGDGLVVAGQQDRVSGRARAAARSPRRWSP